MRILFITNNNIQDQTTGGGQCSRRNYDMLCRGNQVTVKAVTHVSAAGSALSLLEGNVPPLRNRDLREIEDIVRRQDIELVYVDRSLLGRINRRLRKTFPKLPLITFFHNIETDYIRAIEKDGVKRRVYTALMGRAEQWSVRCADGVIALTERDARRIRRVYGDREVAVIPITFADRYDESAAPGPDPFPAHPAGLMVGALHPDTYENVKWFCENVAPHTSAHYCVVGKNFETRRQELESSRVTVVGTAEDLSAYYRHADFVVLPVFSGAGMKVKTAEALMYGKTIFAADEALVGYELDMDRAGKRCNTAGEFVAAIDGFTGPAFNPYCRQVFREKYSEASAAEKFAAILSAVGKETL